MAVWRYYLKMIRYEQFLVPAAMLGICLLLLLLMKGNPSNDPSTTVALAFVEAALPLALAIIANSLFLDDPALEMHYTVPRPLWRTILEKAVLLFGIMTGFYLLGIALMFLLGAPMVGWGILPTGILVWVIPAMAWLGLAFALGAILRSGVTGNALTALVWIICFLVRSPFLDSSFGRMIFPFLTLFEPNSADWLMNRLGLLIVGLVGIGIALMLLRNGERYFKSEA